MSDLIFTGTDTPEGALEKLKNKGDLVEVEYVETVRYVHTVRADDLRQVLTEDQDANWVISAFIESGALASLRCLAEIEDSCLTVSRMPQLLSL